MQDRATPDNSNFDWKADILRALPASKRALTRMPLHFLALAALTAVMFIRPIKHSIIWLFVELLMMIAIGMWITFKWIIEVAADTLNSSIPTSAKPKFWQMVRLVALSFVATFIWFAYELPVSSLKHLFLHDRPDLIGADLFFLAVWCIALTPMSWWAMKSVLSSTLVCLEDIGFFASLIRSHEMIDDRFWWMVRYTGPAIFLFQFIPDVICEVVSHWNTSLHAKDRILTAGELGIGTTIYVLVFMAGFILPLVGLVPLFLRVYSLAKAPLSQAN